MTSAARPDKRTYIPIIEEKPGVYYVVQKKKSYSDRLCKLCVVIFGASAGIGLGYVSGKLAFDAAKNGDNAFYPSLAGIGSAGCWLFACFGAVIPAGDKDPCEQFGIENKV